MTHYVVTDQPILVARIEDLPAIVELHQKAFPGFFMTLLGPRFLIRYYRTVLDHPGGILLLQVGARGCLAFVSGFIEPDQFYRRLNSDRVGLLFSILGRILTRPWLLYRLFMSFRASRGAAAMNWDGACELSSVAVDPELGGKGIGQALVHNFIAAVKGKTQAVVLSTDAVNNDRVNAFYLNLGFSLVRSYERSRGRMMNEYRLTL